MIFVTVGNATQGFRRLLDAVDRSAGEGAFGKETVFIQSGNNPGFRPSHCKHEAFLSMDAFETKIHEADLIISHTGAGTLWHALRAGKIPVVMPRQKKYGEVVDDHQLEIAKALAAEGRVVPAYEPEDLTRAIKEAMKRQGLEDGGWRRNEEKGKSEGEGGRPQSPMLKLIEQAIEELVKR